VRKIDLKMPPDWRPVYSIVIRSRRMTARVFELRSCTSAKKQRKLMIHHVTSYEQPSTFSDKRQEMAARSFTTSPFVRLSRNSRKRLCESSDRIPQ
jgi:hypothetical protein